MQKKNIKSGLLLSVLLVYVFIYRFIILKSYLKYSESLTAALIILLTGIAILILGFQKDKEKVGALNKPASYNEQAFLF